MRTPDEKSPTVRDPGLLKRLLSLAVKAVAPKGTKRRAVLAASAKRAGFGRDHVALVHELEGRRLVSPDGKSMKALSKVTAGEILTVLGAQAGFHLLAKRFGQGYGSTEDVPNALRGTPAIVDAVGKRWELKGEVPGWFSEDFPTRVYEKRAIQVERVGLIDGASKLTVTPPPSLTPMCSSPVGADRRMMSRGSTAAGCSCQT